MTAPAAAQFQTDADAYELVHDQLFDSGVLSVLDNDPVLPTGRLVVTVTRAPEHGVLVMQKDGTFTFEPEPGYVGDDSYEYVVELRPIQELTFGPEVMSLDVRAEIDLGTFGSDSDQQTVAVGGTVGLDIGTTGDPLTTLQLVELDVRNNDAIDLDLDYGFFGTIKLDAETQALNLLINQPGPAVVPAPIGFFVQIGNKLGLDAQVFVDGTGAIGAVIDAGLQDVLTETDIDFSGFILKANPTLTLILTVDSKNVFELSGQTIEIDITGQISATGPYIEGAASGPETVNLSIISPVAITENETPGPFRLTSVYPNPVVSTATIQYELERPADVNLAIYDLLGREVESLPVGTRGTGRHSVTWDASALPRGIYLIRLGAGTHTQTRTIVVQ